MFSSIMSITRPIVSRMNDSRYAIRDDDVARGRRDANRYVLGSRVILLDAVCVSYNLINISCRRERFDGRCVREYDTFFRYGIVVWGERGRRDTSAF